jgi:hypothetical protein
MRTQFFAIAITASVAVFSLSPAFAGGNPGDENLGPVSECELREILGEPPCRRLTREQEMMIEKRIEALGDFLRSQSQRRTIIIVPKRDYHPQLRMRRYNDEGDWIYRGGGWVLGDGDVCRGRHQYNPINGRTYCVR